MKAAELVKAAEREIALRRNVYPRQILRGKMTQPEAERQLTIAQAWRDLAALTPAIAAALEAVTAFTVNSPGEIATRDLAGELLGKLREIIEP